ncbi:MAG: tRNA lysidine(34) synthetase TilS, partial [Proteobacteria bacterium]|nr:tRNA lysidine(34) synthetase TilS [Pseudomonadota bacterium]
FADVGQTHIQPADLLPVHDLPAPAQDRLRAMAAQLSVRARKPGDRLDYGGRRRAIKQIFHQEAIPPWLRARVPVVCAQARPLALLLPDRWLADDELTGAQPTSGQGAHNE